MEKLLIALIGTIVGIILTRVISNHKEKVQNTLDLMKEYHSSNMLEQRILAWNVLLKNYPLAPKPFHKWFSSTEYFKDPDYDPIVTVLYFWFRVYVMNKRNLIYPKLSSELLGYQWQHWENVYKPLAKETMDDGEDLPEWLVLFENDNMAWLKKCANKSIQPTAKASAD